MDEINWTELEREIVLAERDLSREQAEAGAAVARHAERVEKAQRTLDEKRALLLTRDGGDSPEAAPVKRGRPRKEA